MVHASNLIGRHCKGCCHDAATTCEHNGFLKVDTSIFKNGSAFLGGLHAVVSVDKVGCGAWDTFGDVAGLETTRWSCIYKLDLLCSSWDLMDLFEQGNVVLMELKAKVGIVTFSNCTWLNRFSRCLPKSKSTVKNTHIGVTVGIQGESSACSPDTVLSVVANDWLW